MPDIKELRDNQLKKVIGGEQTQIPSMDINEKYCNSYSPANKYKVSNPKPTCSTCEHCVGEWPNCFCTLGKTPTLDLT